MANTNKSNKSNKKSTEEKVTVIIPKPSGVIGDTETVVSVNGVMYQIMYDRPVTVPKNAAEIIAQSRDLQMKILEATAKAAMIPGKKALAEL